MMLKVDIYSSTGEMNSIVVIATSVDTHFPFFKLVGLD